MLKLKKALVGFFTCVLLVCLFTAVAYAERVKTGVVTGDQLNLRQSPSTTAKVVTQLPKGAKVQILESTNGWYKITYSELTGWVSDDYISVKEETYQTGVIKGDNINVRSKPELSAEVLTRLGGGTRVNVSESSEGWYKVEYTQGKFGWVYGQYIAVSGSKASRGAVEDATPSVSTPKKQESVTTDLRQQIVAYAKKFLGVKYVYGGSSPKGFDCSGFVQYVYKHFGISLERSAASQAQHGTTVNRNNLKVGDLVFFDTNGGNNNIRHVGIYIGEGKFIHASSGRSAKRVTISNLNDGFYSDAYMKAKRYLK